MNRKKPIAPWVSLNLATGETTQHATGGNNKPRVNRARKALVAGNYIEPAGFFDSAVIDLLSDLRHLCDVQGWDFEHLANISHYHWTEEHGGNDAAS